MPTLRRPAFSLAELMIALAILGFGLLIIGASLPIAMRYTKETIDRDTGAAACNAALGIVEPALTLPRNVVDQAGAFVPSPIFVPRLSDPNGTFDPNHTPLIKVRALVTQNLAATPGVTLYTWEWGRDFPHTEPPPSNIPYFTESIVANWIEQALSINEASPTWRTEADNRLTDRWMRPAIPSAALAYPGVFGPKAYEPGNFYDSFPTKIYERPFEAEVVPAERVLSTRINWVTFYRRVSYGPGSDPLLYEVILVATRKPSERHRYPLQAQVVGDPSLLPLSSLYWGMDTAAPVPWLMSFPTDDPNNLPLLALGTDYDDSQVDRPLRPAFTPPGNLRFIASQSLGSMLPPKSIFIPAVNDAKPTQDASQVKSGGFVPALRDSIPIYTVIERTWDASNSRYELTVDNNGYYPWVSSGRTALDWPVWVIPPAIEETEGEPPAPVFTNQSPVIAIERRFVRLREVR